MGDIPVNALEHMKAVDKQMVMINEIYAVAGPNFRSEILEVMVCMLVDGYRLEQGDIAVLNQLHAEYVKKGK